VTAHTDSYTDLDHMRFFIDGDWVEPISTELHEVIEAATGEPFGQAAMAGEADIDAAPRAARRAFEDGPWGKTTPAERADVLRRLAAALSERADFTSALVTRENGMPIGMSTAYNGLAPAGTLQLYAQLIEDFRLEDVRPSMSGSTIVRYEPVEVVGAIVPWNFPQALGMVKVAPALAAGCTVVLKPSPETALDSYVLGDAAREAGLPPGVLNIVVAGREVGASLVSHPLSTRSPSPARPRPGG
jgi:aldehyde dehydrogenase (NAD+)